MANFFPPKTTSKYCVIVNEDDNQLAAIVCSYLIEKHSYLPVFAFPKTEVFSNQEIENPYSAESRTKTNAIELSIWIKNVLLILQKCEVVILVGLSDQQKSFIDIAITRIEIQNTHDIHLISHLSEKTEYLQCKTEEIHLGIIEAYKSNKYLIVDEYSESINEINRMDEKGVVVIENLGTVSTVVAINYAYSIDAFPVIIDKPDLTMKEVNNLLADWRDTGNLTFLNDLKAKIYPSIENIQFPDFEFATFFTVGIPYSLSIENVIPCSHINLKLRPDFFIFHTIFAEERLPTHGAVIFSPEDFIDQKTGKPEEETQFVVDTLSKNFYHTKEVFGLNATCANLDYHVKAFPFDIFHICAHGGEAFGTPMSAEIYDEEGNKHIFEYDLLLSFAPYPGMDKIKVVDLKFPRKLDGLTWKSEELKNKGFSRSFYEDIFVQLQANKGEKTGDQIKIHNSFGISCNDFVYTGQFNIIAGINSFPVIYNNACWSGGEISKSFLNSGARMYIGNLWNINHQAAIDIAKKFYDLIFDTTILEAFYNAIEPFKGTEHHSVGIVWGLHFSTMRKGISAKSSKFDVASKLYESYVRWNEHEKNSNNPSGNEQIHYMMQWIQDQLTRYYSDELNIINPHYL